MGLTQMSDRQLVSIREVELDHEGRRLDNFLTTLMGGVPRALVYRIIRSGEVRVNGKRAQPAQRLVAGDKVRVPPFTPHDAAVPQIGAAMRQTVAAAIVYEDDQILLLNKPSGLAVHAGSGLPFGVIDVVRVLRPECSKIELVHRLDRETSGCLLLAKDIATLRALHLQLREGRMHKGYVALLNGHLPAEPVRCDAPLAMVMDGQGERRAEVSATGVAARTEFRVRARLGRWTYSEIILDTGRTHQIRAHAAYLGHAVAGDPRYGDPTDNQTLRALGLNRTFLHAEIIEFEHAGPQRFCVPLPAELSSVLSRLSA